jgi:hypothetical protein
VCSPGFYLSEACDKNIRHTLWPRNTNWSVRDLLVQFAKILAGIVPLGTGLGKGRLTRLNISQSRGTCCPGCEFRDSEPNDFAVQ